MFEKKKRKERKGFTLLYVLEIPMPETAPEGRECLV